MSDASGKDWLQFLASALFAVPFLLIPTVVVNLWLWLFKFINP